MHILWRRSQFRRPLHNPAMLCGQTPASARCCSRPQPRSVSCSISTGDGGTDRDTRGTTRLASTTDGRTDSPASRESWTPSVQWRSMLSILTFHNCRLPKNSIRLPAQRGGRSSRLELWQPEVCSSKLGRDTDKTV